MSPKGNAPHADALSADTVLGVENIGNRHSLVPENYVSLYRPPAAQPLV
jgi:hypothetical protein